MIGASRWTVYPGKPRRLFYVFLSTLKINAIFMNRDWGITLCIFLVIAGCHSGNDRLPVLGEKVFNGKDSVSPTIAPFLFTDQDGNPVSQTTLAGKIYVADFIFLSCPTICPVMTREMNIVYKEFKQDDRIQFVSHTIDPKHDSIPRLKAYASALGVDGRKWHFVTGSQDSIMHIAEESYFSTAMADSTSPGGYTHSGGLLLIDKTGHIRGVYNGTDPQETKRLIKDIRVLLKE